MVLRRLNALRLREQPAVRSGFNTVMNTLNLKQAAAFLHIHPEELRSRAKRGLIPGAKVGRRWVFL
jgi:Helix-turn-helix domain